LAAGVLRARLGAGWVVLRRPGRGLAGVVLVSLARVRRGAG